MLGILARGRGLDCVAGSVSGYAHGSELSHGALFRAGDVVTAVKRGHGGIVAIDASVSTKRHLNSEDNPVDPMPFAKKIVLLEEVGAFFHEQNLDVRQVCTGLSSSGKRSESLVQAGMLAAIFARSPATTSLSLSARGNVSKWVVREGGSATASSNGCTKMSGVRKRWSAQDR